MAAKPKTSPRKAKAIVAQAMKPKPAPGPKQQSAQSAQSAPPPIYDLTEIGRRLISEKGHTPAEAASMVAKAATLGEVPDLLTYLRSTPDPAATPREGKGARLTSDPKQDGQDRRDRQDSTLAQVGSYDPSHPDLASLPDYTAFPDVMTDLPALLIEHDSLKAQLDRIDSRFREVKEEIVVRLLACGEKSVRCLKWRVTKGAGCNVSINAKRLLELGVSADIVHQAEKRTPYDYPVVTDTTKPKEKKS